MRTTSLAIGLSLFLATGAASAQDGWVPKAMYSRVGVEFDFWSTKSVNALSWDVEAQLALTKNAMIDVDLPLGYSILNQEALVGDPVGGAVSKKAIFGDVGVGAHWADKITPDMAAWAGAMVSIPTQLMSPSFEDLLPSLPLAENRAFYDYQRFAAEEVSIRPRGGIEYRPIPIVYIRVDAAPNLLVPAKSEAKSAFLLDQSNEVEARLFGFGGGLRLQETFFLAGQGIEDRIQTALEPFVDYEAPRSGLFARIGFLVALDKQLGFGFDEGKLRTLRINAGGKF